jgi:hypothetical protein
MRSAVFFSISVLAIAVIGIVPSVHVQTTGVPEAAGKAASAEPAAPASGRTVTIDRRAVFNVASAADPGAAGLPDQRLDRRRHQAHHAARAHRYRHQLAHRTHRRGTVLARRGSRSHLARHVVPVPRVLGAPRRMAAARVAAARQHRLVSYLCAVHSVRHASAARHASHRLVRAQGAPTQRNYSVSADARFRDRWSGSSPKPHASPVGEVISATMRRNALPSSRFCTSPSASPSFASWSSI